MQIISHLGVLGHVWHDIFIFRLFSKRRLSHFYIVSLSLAVEEQDKRPLNCAGVTITDTAVDDVCLLVSHGYEQGFPDAPS